VCVVEHHDRRLVHARSLDCHLAQLFADLVFVGVAQRAAVKHLDI